MKYALGERITPLVPIENIDRVPVTFIHSTDDNRCLITYAERLYAQLPTPEKYFLTRLVKHYEWARLDDYRGWYDEIEEIIETGHTSEIVSDK